MAWNVRGAMIWTAGAAGSRKQPVGKLPGRADARPGPHLHQAPGDPPRRRLLAVLVDDAGQLGLGRPPDDLGGGQRLPCVEAHVERLVPLEREAAPAPLQLERGQPQVEEDGVRRDRAARPGLGVERAEVGVPEDAPIFEWGEPARGVGERLLVPVEAEEAALGGVRQERRRVAAESHGPIDDPGAGWHGGEPAQDLVDEHRDVERLGRGRGIRTVRHRAHPCSDSLRVMSSKPTRSV
jgi:hypothetical protein